MQSLGSMPSDEVPPAVWPERVAQGAERAAGTWLRVERRLLHRGRGRRPAPGNGYAGDSANRGSRFVARPASRAGRQGILDRLPTAEAPQTKPEKNSRRPAVDTYGQPLVAPRAA